MAGLKAKTFHLLCFSFLIFIKNSALLLSVVTLQYSKTPELLSYSTFLVYLTDRETDETHIHRKRDRALNCLFTAQMPKCLGRASLKPGARNAIWTPMEAAGTELCEPSPAAAQGLHWQEANVRARALT